MTGEATEGWGSCFWPMPSAALGSIVLLVAVLMVSTFALVPEQPRLAARRRGAGRWDCRLVDPYRHLDPGAARTRAGPAVVVAVVNAWVLPVEVVRRPARPHGLKGCAGVLS